MLQGEVLCQLVLKYKWLPTFKKNLKLVKNGPHKHKEDYLKPIEYRLTVAAVECNLYVNTQAIKSKRLWSLIYQCILKLNEKKQSKKFFLISWVVLEKFIDDIFKTL